MTPPEFRVPCSRGSTTDYIVVLPFVLQLTRIVTLLSHSPGGMWLSVYVTEHAGHTSSSVIALQLTVRVSNDCDLMDVSLFPRRELRHGVPGVSTRHLLGQTDVDVNPGRREKPAQ